MIINSPKTNNENNEKIEDNKNSENILSNIEFCYMTEKDIEYLEDCLEDFDEFWNYSLVKAEYENTSVTSVVAKYNNLLVGYAFLWDTPDDAQINNIVVKKNYRKNGIGNLLLDKLIKIAIKKGKKEISLEVNVNNISAIKLYEKNNFKRVGLRKKYYNNTDDAIIMRKDIKK